MDKIRKSSGNGAMLYGANLPKNCIYGKVNYTYICKDFHGFKGGFNILRYNPNTGHWFRTVSDNDLTAIIAHYVKTAEPEDLRIEQVTHNTRMKNKAFYARKKAEAQQAREDREMRSFCEQQVPFRRNPVSMQRAWNQSCVDGRTYLECNINTECTYESKHIMYNLNTAPSAYRGKGEDMSVMHNPKDYQRDSLKHPFDKYPKNDKNGYPKNSGSAYTGHAELKQRDDGTHYVKIFNDGYTSSPAIATACEKLKKRLEK